MFKRMIAMTLGLSLMTSVGLQAATTATATVTYSVGSIDAISVSGNPGQLNITTATAGSTLTPAVDATTTYSVTTNNSSKKISAALGASLGTGYTLNISLAAPSGATSTPQNVTSTAQDVVTGITQLNASALAITYTFSATLAAAQIPIGTPLSATVTYTIH